MRYPDDLPLSAQAQIDGSFAAAELDYIAACRVVVEPELVNGRLMYRGQSAVTAPAAIQAALTVLAMTSRVASHLWPTSRRAALFELVLEDVLLRFSTTRSAVMEAVRATDWWTDLQRGLAPLQKRERESVGQQLLRWLDLVGWEPEVLAEKTAKDGKAPISRGTIERWIANTQSMRRANRLQIQSALSEALGYPVTIETPHQPRRRRVKKQTPQNAAKRR